MLSNKLYIIDAEVHLLHPPAHDKNYLKGSQEPVRLAIHEHQDFEKLAGRLGIDDLLDSMNQNGIQYSVIMGMPWHDEAVQKENNDFIAECVQLQPERLKGFYIPNFKNIDKAVDEISRLDKKIFKGIKMLPSWQNISLNDPLLLPVFEIVENRDLFLMIHTDHPTQSDDGDTPFKLLRFLQSHPNIKVLAPHLGGLLCLYALVPEISNILKNVIFITSVSKTMKMVKFAADINPDNIIFGTDFPFNHCHDQVSPLTNLKLLDISMKTKEKLLGLTAKKMLGFE